MGNALLMGQGYIPKLTGDAAVGDVASGKTFYNTDAETKLTGTGANAKRMASGTYGTYGGSSVTSFTVSGLSFTPHAVLVSYLSGAIYSPWAAGTQSPYETPTNSSGITFTSDGFIYSSGATYFSSAHWIAFE